MEHMISSAHPVDTVRARVKQLRRSRGWTGAELGKRLADLGVPWDRSIVANFEAGRRRVLSIDELLVLALIFDVAPINMFVPLDDRPYRVAPNRVEGADTVRAWVRGEAPLPGTDERTFRAEVSLADLRREHTTTLEQQAAIVARYEGITFDAALQKVVGRLGD